MGRFLMYATIVLLAVFVLSSVTLLKHGGEGLSQVKILSVHDLTTGASAYRNAAVTVDGTLIYNNDLRTFELTDNEANYPTPLRGLSDDVLAPLAGKRVRVNGKYVYESGEGSHIDADEIRPIESSSPSPTATGP